MSLETAEALFSKDKDYYQREIKHNLPDISRVVDSASPVIIYGAAKAGTIIKNHLENIDVEILAFGDSSVDKQGTIIDGIPVISAKAIEQKYQDIPVIIASVNYETEIYDMLKELNISYIYPLSYLNYYYPDIFPSRPYFRMFDLLFQEKNKRSILSLESFLADKKSLEVLHNNINFRISFDNKYLKDSRDSYQQYFDADIIKLSDSEVFLDCGAYYGDTLQIFLEQSRGRYNKIYCFEPDRINFDKLNNIARQNDPDNIIAVPCGVYSSSGDLMFREDGNEASAISEIDGNIKLQTVSLDEYMADKEIPTYIKMDIEGAEEQALLGAKDIIRRYKPKLAVCVYHKSHDIWSLPLLIKKINPDYKLFLRHYSDVILETVIYAI